MPTKIQFLTAVLSAEITEPLGLGIKIADNLFLSNDSGIPKKLLDRDVIESIGMLEYESLLRSRLFVYGDWSEDVDFSSCNNQAVLTEKICKVQAFFFLLWMIKDNGAKSELSFLIKRNSFLAPCVSSNLLYQTPSRHDISGAIVGFSKAEVASAMDKFGNFFHAVVGQEARTEVEMAQKQGRVERAFQFVIAARASSFTFLKIANYCSALESLFCSDSNEISHKLAERVAAFMEKSPGRRIELYRQVKEAYGLRSKIIHGSKVKNEVADLIRICATLDEVVRGVLTRMTTETELFDFYQTQGQMLFEKRMMEMVFQPDSHRSVTETQVKTGNNKSQ